MIKAILLDLDGVIADSEKMRTQYVQKVMKRTFRISIPDRFFDNLFGVKDSEIIERIFARYRIIAPIDEIIVNKKKDLVPMYKNVRMFPGAEVFLKNASHTPRFISKRRKNSMSNPLSVWLLRILSLELRRRSARA